MKLHLDNDAFEEIVIATAEEFNLNNFQVEKDYYVSCLLKKIVEVSPDVIFKGGTSLSKCYDIIDRFSEDIDLTVYFEDVMSFKTKKKKNKALKDGILSAIEELGFSLLTPVDQIMSGSDFIQYEIDYKKTHHGEAFMTKHILVETILTYRPYPCDTKSVNSYITKYLTKSEQPQIIEDYDLQPFMMNIQTIDRTFIDKLFAICDYHHDEKYDRYSRHLYDIHKIYHSNLLSREGIPDLIKDVIEIRRNGHNTHSCQPGYELAKVLHDIANSGVFKNDYETNTREFLSVYVDYEDTIATLRTILNENWLPVTIAEYA